MATKTRFTPGRTSYTAPRKVFLGNKLRAELRSDGRWYCVNVRNKMWHPCDEGEYLLRQQDLTPEHIDFNLSEWLKTQAQTIGYMIR